MSVSAGTPAISDINGSHLRNLAKEHDSLGWAAATLFSSAQAVFVCWLERRDEHNKFFCTKTPPLGFGGGDLCGQLEARLMLWLTCLFELNEMFFSFADTGDHTPVIITMAAYTSLCKCLLAWS